MMQTDETTSITNSKTKLSTNSELLKKFKGGHYSGIKAQIIYANQWVMQSYEH